MKKILGILGILSFVSVYSPLAFSNSGATGQQPDSQINCEALVDSDTNIPTTSESEEKPREKGNVSGE